MRPGKQSPFIIWSRIGVLFALLCTGCSSTKEYVNTYMDQSWNPKSISRVTIVVEDRRVTESHNLLFADTIVKTALEKKHPRLAGDTYVLKDTLLTSGAPKEADAYLEIALTHCYPGNQTDHFPTSVGAVAKLVDPKTQKTLWHITYAYASPKGGASAPSVEKVMHQVAAAIIEAVPLVPEKAIHAAYSLNPEENRPSPAPPAKKSAEHIDSAQSLKARFSGAGAEKPAAVAAIPKEAAAPAGRQPSGAFMIHVASVKNREFAEQFIDRQPADGTLRLSTVVQLNPEKPSWYRLLVGRFQTQDEAKRYIQTMKQKDRSGAYAKPMKLPFSLRISASRPLEPSRKIAKALRKVDCMAYLAPSERTAKTFDVLVGAYGSRKEADERARLLLSNGVPVEVVTP